MAVKSTRTTVIPVTIAVTGTPQALNLDLLGVSLECKTVFVRHAKSDDPVSALQHTNTGPINVNGFYIPVAQANPYGTEIPTNDPRSILITGTANDIVIVTVFEGA